MLHYGLYIGRNESGIKSLENLEEDLIVIARNNGGRLAISSRQIIQDSGKPSQQISKSYEISSEGALSFTISSDRDRTSDNIQKYNGVVTCLGFDESRVAFKQLDKELYILSEDYSSDRTQS